ncbi:MAG: hypothetical protein M3R36_04460 [Bacteroidota bacterium]|nr:hypothetical protein [Bacteroidota bacterium]
MKSKKINRNMKSVFKWILFPIKWFGKFLFALFIYNLILAIFWAFPSKLLFWGQYQQPAINIITIIVGFIYFTLALYFLNRKNFFDDFKKENILGVISPIVCIIAVVGVGCSCFAALSSLLSDYGYISFEPSLGVDKVGAIMNIYIWHFLNVIPQLKINETLKWELPFKHNGSIMNILILSFNIIMIWLVIKVFYKWNVWRKELIKRRNRAHESTTKRLTILN